MESRRTALSAWSPEQVAIGRAWVDAWRNAAPRLEAIRRRELRELDAFTAISHLCGPRDYYEAPHAPQQTSGLVEQQRLFARLRRQ